MWWGIGLFLAVLVGSVFIVAWLDRGAAAYERDVNDAVSEPCVGEHEWITYGGYRFCARCPARQDWIAGGWLTKDAA